jgi:ribosome-associated toxin RatA of RatAB toxin-antitoxin module
MTHTENEIVIEAPPHVIYNFACATDRWPQYLPHYRDVKVLGETNEFRIVEMSAMRDLIPVHWIAAQQNDPLTPAIRFVHVRGWTRGMDVRWRFERLAPSRTRVVIEHDLAFRFPFAADAIGEYIVGDFFIRNVASKTLARMKMLSEAAV